MKALVYTKYGDPQELRLSDVPIPVPDENEVLVKIMASSVNYSDLAMTRGKPFMVRMLAGGLSKPKYTITGKDIAGVVEKIGRKVSQFKPGDKVFGDLSDCGFGAYAEFVAVPETALALMPANVSFEEAACAPEAAVVALKGLRDCGHIRPGQQVLIHGATGGIGSFALQLAKHFGAQVTAVCSTRNIEMVRSLGADHVIDYTRHDFSKNALTYDLILATAGYRSLFDYEKALKPDGIYVATGGSMAQIFQPMLLGPWIKMTSGKRMVTLSSAPNQADLCTIAELMEAGIVKPYIDRRYPLAEVGKALSYYGEGHTRGKISIQVAEQKGIDL